ncbi:MAG: tRNA (N6-isopentenyl adenosine(37)-C2)-methylthiotransferase MiaB [Bacillota bacterium]
MYYLIETFGCQMNAHDSEVLAGLLEEMGYRPAKAREEADLILLNTCCVRESAENKVWGRLGVLKRLKRENPGLIIGVCGCMAQEEGTAERIRRRYPHVDLVFGTHNVHRLPDLIREARESNALVVEVLESEGGIVEHLPAKRAPGLSAWVTVMYGCNNFCSYCIVPYVRGRQRSREPRSVIDEVSSLFAEGYKEVTLLGQNVNAYGRDLAEEYDFADLLSELDRLDHAGRIRYMTSHPRDFSDKLIDVLSKTKHVCEHIHLPVQAGSDRILSLMNRGYTRDGYLALVQRIRKAIPNASITTDIIVGFPGESESEFEETLDLVKQVRFDAAFTFVYSPRRGTRAAAMENQVPADEKQRRITALVELQNRITKEVNNAMIGRIEEVLVEGPSEKEPEKLSGRTRGNKVVIIDSKQHPGALVNVRITDGGTYYLKGEILR